MKMTLNKVQMAERMIAIIRDPDHPVCRLTNIRLPNNGEPTDDVLLRGISTLRNHAAGLVDDVLYHTNFGLSYMRYVNPNDTTKRLNIKSITG